MERLTRTAPRTTKPDKDTKAALRHGVGVEPLVRRTDALCSFGGMCWPNAWVALDSLEWELRYGHIDRSDKMLAATIIAAYREIISCTRNKREYVVRELRKIRDV